MKNKKLQQNLIREEEKAKRIATNSNSYDILEYYRDKYEKPNRIDSAEIQDNEETILHIQSKPCKRQLNNAGIAFELISGTALGASIGIAGALNQDLAIYEQLYFSILGTGLGFGLGFINGVAYENKPVTNFIDGLRKTYSKKRNEKLQHKIDFRNHFLSELEKNLESNPNCNQADCLLENSTEDHTL